MISEDLTLASIYKCTKCGLVKVDHPKDCCNYPQNKKVRYYKDEDDALLFDDNYLIFNQCQNCGRKNGQAFKKSDFKKEDLETFDYDLLRKREDLIKKKRTKINELENWKKLEKKENFWDDYNEYLKTNQWLEKREIVLKRDNYLCQSCLKEKATQVHHKTGYFRKNEPLFSLVSVCDRCHKIITEIERGNHENVDKIKH